MKTPSIMLLAFLMAFISGCSSVKFAPTNEPAKFYSDKLHCETIYSEGYSFFGSKEYGDIRKAGPAQDCMLAKGYVIEN